MEYLFKLDDIEPIQRVTVSQKEFFEKTKFILEKIMYAYSSNTSYRRLGDEEYPDESICDKCEGCGTFKNLDGEEKECIKNREEGECYNRFVDFEEFGLEIESQFKDIYELLCVDEIV